ncbi:MAG: hypothetical protein M3320_03705, partial [Actinomycetota bacterium]|nr:hypothetical protein [Actinomycetota bacterium]
MFPAATKAKATKGKKHAAPPAPASKPPKKQKTKAAAGSLLAKPSRKDARFTTDTQRQARIETNEGILNPAAQYTLEKDTTVARGPNKERWVDILHNMSFKEFAGRVEDHSDNPASTPADLDDAVGVLHDVGHDALQEWTQKQAANHPQGDFMVESITKQNTEATTARASYLAALTAMRASGGDAAATATMRERRRDYLNALNNIHGNVAQLGYAGPNVDVSGDSLHPNATQVPPSGSSPSTPTAQPTKPKLAFTGKSRRIAQDAARRTNGPGLTRTSSLGHIVGRRGPIDPGALVTP